MIGRHAIKTWARTQETVAISTAEAELTAMVKTACEAVGIKAMLKDLGKEVTVEVAVDASAAIAVANRTGLGKLRHVNVAYLWIQQKEARKEMVIRKIPGTENPADMMTKIVEPKTMAVLAKKLNVKFEKSDTQNVERPK